MTDHKNEAERLSEEIATATADLLDAGNDIPIPALENWSRNVARELSRAQLHATLYLAEQQRIANLIALATCDLTAYDFIVTTEGDAEQIKRGIREGVGL